MSSTEPRGQDFAAENAESKPIVKKCGCCQQFKQANLENFSSNTGAPSGLYSKCRECKSGKKKKVTDVTGCLTCKQVKPSSEFYENRSVCKRCRCKRTYATMDKVKAAVRHKRWRTNNSDKHNKSGLIWKHENGDRRKEYNKGWADRNKDKRMATCSKRRASKLNATPAWADHEKIRMVYAECIRLTSETGVIHEVDHIVPLQGKNVCGFHVHYNLQAIPRDNNRTKGNRYESHIWKNDTKTVPS